MNDNTFAQVNTEISIHESSFLSPAQYEQLLRASTSESRSAALEGTAYNPNHEQLTDLNTIERFLMKHLFAEYTWAFEVSPTSALVEFFTLKYTYHNLKVLLKHKATGLNLKHLLIPVGSYSLDMLEQLITTFSTEYCPKLMVDEIEATWAEYQDYQDVRVLEIGMDLAYFKHLKSLEATFEDERLKQLVRLTIDFYNAVTVQRAIRHQKPHSFMTQLLSDEGSLTSAEWIELAEKGDLASWFSKVNPLEFDAELRSYEEKMHLGKLTNLELEYLADLVPFKLLEQGRFETSGPLPLARYLLGKELEVKNLRLILTGLTNQLPVEIIKERMRPIYGQ
ncbi:V-type ATPase subunit [Streptococcus constellatus subsp. viborgensis]|uniref:V-type ATPase subunit n=1 Tax=Streptococcus constellatus TaxID=76860 RepID=UPI0018E1D053|nr:V-type ATPase subunit [Streptococcus constellatus]QQC22324.1 V-type ATPase subunit [Streptococcus constellatus]